MLAGCGKSADEQGGETPSSTESGVSTETVNFLNADGEANYRVIRSESANPTVIKLAADVYKSLRSAHGVNFKNITDFDADDGSYEILIGDTNRPESKAAREYILDNLGGRHDDYVITTMGKKIVIYGMTDASLTAAVQYFIDQYSSQATIEGGILYTVKTEGEFMDITINGVSIAKFSVVRPHFNSSYLTYAETESMLNEICKKTGFSLPLNDDTVTEETEYEIIIGDSARPGVTAISDRDEYGVNISGKKVYLCGGSHSATTLAVTEFAKKLMAGNVTDADSSRGSYTETVANYDHSTYYTPAFYDDFDGDTLDTTKWQLRGGDGNSKQSAAGVNGSRADRSTDPSRVYVRDGLFQIHPYYDENSNVYYGGYIETKDSMKFTFGYIEMSAKIPHGDGFWTSLWMRCGDYSGAARPEIDVNESYGNASVVAANLHTWPGDEAEKYGVVHKALSSKKYPDTKRYCVDGKLFSEDFHTFGLLWTDEAAIFTCDGKPYFHYVMGDDKATDFQCFSKRMHVVISEAVGFETNSLDIRNATEEQWENSSQFYVDWLYIYQIEDGKQVMDFYS